MTPAEALKLIQPLVDSAPFTSEENLKEIRFAWATLIAVVDRNEKREHEFIQALRRLSPPSASDDYEREGEEA